MSARVWGRFRPDCGANTVAVDIDSLNAFLRRAHPRGTAAWVAARTEHAGSPVPEETVRNWLKRRNGPSLRHMAALRRVYGPAVVAAAMPSEAASLADLIRQQRLAEAEEARAALDAEIAALRAGAAS